MTYSMSPGFYMLAHSSVDVLPQGSVTTLTSPVRRGVSHTECVHFWYHTGGEKPGTMIQCQRSVYTTIHSQVLTVYVSLNRYTECLCEANSWKQDTVIFQ